MHDAFLPRAVPTPSLTTLATGNPATEITVDNVTFLWTMDLGVPLSRVIASPYTGSPCPTSILFGSPMGLEISQAFYAGGGNQYNALSRPVVSSALINRLPSQAVRENLLTSLTTTLILHPICSTSNLERRLRQYDQIRQAGAVSNEMTIAFYAVSSAACALGALSYHAERRAWKLAPDFGEGEGGDPAKLYDLARQSLSLAENNGANKEDDWSDMILAGLLLVVFVLHSRELDGYKAVMSGISSLAVRTELRRLATRIRFYADEMGLLKARAADPNAGLFRQEERHMLAAAVAYYTL